MPNKIEKPESSTTQLTRGGLLTFWVKVSALILGFAVQLLIARILGKAGYGDYSFAITTFNFLVIAAVAGSDSGTTRFVAAYRESSQRTFRFLRWVNRRAIMCSLPLLLGAILVIQAIKQFDPRAIWTITQISIVALPLQVFALIRQGILRGRKRPVLSVIPEEVIRPLVTLVLVSLVVLNGASVVRR